MSTNQDNEDQVIADSLMRIRSGIIAGDWQVVCDGYNAVSGENLSPPASVATVSSKLDKIRSLLKKPTANTDAAVVVSTEVVADEDAAAVDLDKMTVKDLRAYAVGIGVAESVAGKSKPQILKLVKQALKDNKITVVTKKSGTLQIITTAEDPGELARNAAEASKKPKMPTRQPRKIDLASLERSKNPDAPVRYLDKPTTQPPWR